jgi:prolyl-tRNA editing enzyme YbaK/EbsC (Cys-tRNA(Pro) deacylase)
MRNPIEQRVVDHLGDLGARYEILDCDPALADTAAFCEHYGYGMDVSANAIVIASRRPLGKACVCLGLATTRLDVNRRVKGLLGVSKLSFASPEATVEATGMEIGGVTPFGLPEGLPIYVDGRIPQLERCIVGGGSRSIKLLIDPEVFVRMPGVEVVEGLAS